MRALLKEMISLCLYLLVILLCTYLFVHLVAQRTSVEGSSMRPLLSNGDQVLVDKISYRWKDPRRYDVIVFPNRYERESFFVKRIIGLPGEKVQIDPAGTIYINGEPLEENYGAEPIAHSGVAATPRILGKDEYFVLGDNRNHSNDSRDATIGVIRRDEIIGIVSFRIFPFTKLGWIRAKKGQG